MFRGHVLRRAHDLLCRCDRCTVLFVTEQRQSEVQQPNPPVAVQHQVRGFDVPVNNQSPVGILDSFANLQKQPQPRLHAERMMRQVFIQRDAVDVFHHYEWQTCRSCPPIQQSRYEWMLQICQNLTLTLKLGDDSIIQGSTTDNLDGNGLGKGAIIPLCEINLTHPPFAQELNNSIGTKLLPGKILRRTLHRHKFRIRTTR